MRNETRKRRKTPSAALVVSFLLHFALLAALAGMQMQERAKTETAFDFVHVNPVKRAEEPLKRRAAAIKEANRPMTRSEADPGRALKAPALSKAVAPSRPFTMRSTVALPDMEDSALQLAGPTAAVQQTPSGNQIGTGLAKRGRGVGAGDRPSAGSAGLSRLIQSNASGEEESIEAPKNPLARIAEDMVKSSDSDAPVDLVFLLDISNSMQDNIYSVARRLQEMAALLEEGSVDFQIGIVTFHTRMPLKTESVEIMKLTDDIEKVRKKLRSVKCSGGEKSLNAIMKSVGQVKFRKGAERRFVFVTDEAANGDVKGSAVMGALYRSKIKVDVIGVDEPFQRSMAAETGGIWLSIKNLNI